MYKSVTLYQQLQEKNNLRLFSLMVVVDNYQIQSILDPLYFSFNCNPYSPCFYSVVDRCPGEHSGRQHRHLDGGGAMIDISKVYAPKMNTFLIFFDCCLCAVYLAIKDGCASRAWADSWTWFCESVFCISRCFCSCIALEDIPPLPYLKPAVFTVRRPSPHPIWVRGCTWERIADHLNSNWTRQTKIPRIFISLKNSNGG